MNSGFIPKDYQLKYSLDQKIIQGRPAGEVLSFSALFVGAGPASLSGAIRLKQLLPDLSIGVIEKAGRLGGHTLSGAVINPLAFKKLFPQMTSKDWPFYQKVVSERMYFLTKTKAYRIPAPPTMKNKGFFTASLCEVVRWLGKKAEELGVDIFPSTPAHKLILEKNRVIGIQTTPYGLDRNGEKTSQYQEPINILAENIFLADGVRGNLSQAWLKWKNISSCYPSQYSLGIKEVWKIKHLPKDVIHTVGYPLKGFGGSFLYPLSSGNISVGLVAGMGHSSSQWNVNKQFQQMKEHPFFKKILEGGECLEWGAKVIPEGGFYSTPDRLYEDGVFIIGDSAGLVNVPSLKGIHYAMLSGILSAEFLTQKKKGKTTGSYEDVIKKQSVIGRDLYKVRNIVQTLQIENKIVGFIKAGLMALTFGRFPGKLNTKKLLKDNQKKRFVSSSQQETTDVFKSVFGLFVR